MMKPTEQQQLILDYNSNAVVIAAPGSGKTYVISEKIRNILSELYEHEGVVAISYTNKASNELKGRSLKNGVNAKNSFFGTIDSFFISEIIIPFGKQVFGIPSKAFETIKINSLSDTEQLQLEWASREIHQDKLSAEHIECIKLYFLQGILLMETLGVLGNYIFSISKACQNYIQARFKFIFIDEYQDSGINQHLLFLKITQLGIIGIAVGDINQSIYKFSGKDSRFLNELSQRNDFKKFILNKNHRCHPSIINYSNYLLDPKTELINTSKSHVFFFRVNGNEISISKWIDKQISNIKQIFSIKTNSEIGILTRSQRTADILNEYLNAPHRLSMTTDLDMSLHVWSGIFTNLLHFAFDKNFRFTEVIEAFSSFENYTKSELKRLNSLKREIKGFFNHEILDKENIISTFHEIAKIISPKLPPGDSIELLLNVLNDEKLLRSFKPSIDNEISIMTLHKSKGLEFDFIFHLDLHEWVLPQKELKIPNDWDSIEFKDWIQDINLHYVGVTRARKACFLISSTERTNNQGQIKRGKDSEFLWLNDIDKLRYQKKN